MTDVSKAEDVEYTTIAQEEPVRNLRSIKFARRVQELVENIHHVNVDNLHPKQLAIYLAILNGARFADEISKASNATTSHVSSSIKYFEQEIAKKCPNSKPPETVSLDDGEDILTFHTQQKFWDNELQEVTLWVPLSDAQEAYQYGKDVGRSVLNPSQPKVQLPDPDVEGEVQIVHQISILNSLPRTEIILLGTHDIQPGDILHIYVERP